MTHGDHKHDPKDPACLEVFARLSDYIDGELPPDACRQIEEHIADCPPCVDFLRSLRGSVRAAHQFQGGEEPQPIPAELESRLKAAWQAALARRSAS